MSAARRVGDIALLFVASGFAYAGNGYARIRVTWPGSTIAGLMIAIWLLIYTAGVATFVYERLPDRGKASSLKLP
jgi:hypothetical protein